MSVTGLKSFQTIIAPATLYRVIAHPSQSLARRNESQVQLRANIESFGGDPIDVYGSQVLANPAPAGMPKIFTGLAGIAPFDFVPNYIYAGLTGDAPDAVVLTGVEAGAIMQAAAANYIETFIDAPANDIPTENAEAENEIITYIDAPGILAMQAAASNEIITYVDAPATL